MYYSLSLAINKNEISLKKLQKNYVTRSEMIICLGYLLDLLDFSNFQI